MNPGDLDQVSADAAEAVAISRFRALRSAASRIMVACGRCGARQLVGVQPGMRTVALVCDHCGARSLGRVA